jgi:hypothetical protein
MLPYWLLCVLLCPMADANKLAASINGYKDLSSSIELFEPMDLTCIPVDVCGMHHACKHRDLTYDEMCGLGSVLRYLRSSRYAGHPVLSLRCRRQQQQRKAFGQG